MKKFRFGFDIWGLVIFLIVMIPNFIWFAVPAPDDVLRNESITPIVDRVGSVLQVMLVAALCFVINRKRDTLRLSPLIIASAGCILLYFAGWVLYYCGLTHPFVILLLTAPPCLAFVLFALDRKNTAALIPAICFTLCHLIYGFVNFVI